MKNRGLRALEFRRKLNLLRQKLKAKNVQNFKFATTYFSLLLGSKLFWSQKFPLNPKLVSANFALFFGVNYSFLAISLVF